MVARHFMLSLCQLTPLNLEEPLPLGALLRALAFTVTVSPVLAIWPALVGPVNVPRCVPASGFTASQSRQVRLLNTLLKPTALIIT